MLPFGCFRSPSPPILFEVDYGPPSSLTISALQLSWSSSSCFGSPYTLRGIRLVPRARCTTSSKQLSEGISTHPRKITRISPFSRWAPSDLRSYRFLNIQVGSGGRRIGPSPIRSRATLAEKPNGGDAEPKPKHTGVVFLDNGFHQMGIAADPSSAVPGYGQF